MEHRKTPVLESLFNKETPAQLFYRTPWVTASEKYEYIV